MHSFSAPQSGLCHSSSSSIAVNVRACSCLQKTLPTAAPLHRLPALYAAQAQPKPHPIHARPKSRNEPGITRQGAHQHMEADYGCSALANWHT